MKLRAPIVAIFLAGGRGARFALEKPGANKLLEKMPEGGIVIECALAPYLACLDEIIAVVAPDEDLSDLRGDVRLRDQLDMDSMDFLDIVMELRKRHKIQVPEADYKQLASLASTVAYLQPMLKDVVKK
mgnify:CR=1 FL=1